ncbi:hypothetical protein VQ056_06450 [Paenibacillus sp. JTLBN-2024]
MNVQDRGVGIPKADLPMFRPFYTGENGRRFQGIHGHGAAHRQGSDRQI